MTSQIQTTMPTMAESDKLNLPIQGTVDTAADSRRMGVPLFSEKAIMEKNYVPTEQSWRTAMSQALMNFAVIYHNEAGGLPPEVSIINPTAMPDGRISHVDDVLIDGEELSFGGIAEKLGLTEIGRAWLMNSVMNHAKKLDLDLITPRVCWGELIDELTAGRTNRAALYVALEQNNPMYERGYHPLPHTQEGPIEYSAYGARALTPKGRGIGGYKLDTISTHDPEVVVSVFADVNEIDPRSLFVHPGNRPFIDYSVDLLQTEYNTYLPGASIRSGMYLVDGRDLDDNTRWIKMCYKPKVTSRGREVPLSEHKQAMAMNGVMKQIIDSTNGVEISMLPDLYAVRDGKTGLSYRMRGSIGDIYPRVSGNDIVIPGFGLYYKSSAVPTSFMSELISRSGSDPLVFLKENILDPVIGAFFDLSIKQGIVHEMHGQNLMLTYDLQQHRTTGVVLRDFESMVMNTDFLEKHQSYDCRLQEQNGTPMNFLCDPKEWGEKVTRRFNHWVMQVFLVPVLNEFVEFTNLPIDQANEQARKSIVGWFEKNDIPVYASLQEQLDLRSYLHTNQMTKEKVPGYRRFGKPSYMP